MRDQIVAEARTWIDTPFGHQHRMKGHLVDCAGLLIGVARALHLVPSDFDVRGYSLRPNGTLLSVCDTFMRRVTDPQPGDAIAVVYDKEAQHLGILAPYRWGGHLSLIHAASNAHPPRVIEHRLMPQQIKICGAWALPGV